MPSFNLLDQPWIPCIRAADGRPEEVSLRDALLRAREIREIADPSPLVAVALHRLLLAILHRNFGPESADAWHALWRRGAWDGAVLEGYFDRWRPRFDLLDGPKPFYQTPRLDFQYAQPVSRLAHELASGGNPVTLFDHTLAPAFSPAAAARCLVAFHSFAVGGMVSLAKGEDPMCKFTDAAPLAKTAVALVKGANLFETLMLNLIHYSPADGRPFQFHGEDLPAWEREEDTRPEDRWPSGYVDLLTWQSRRLRLQPEEDGAGRTIIRQAVVMKGYQFPDGFHRRDFETMVAFRRNKEAKGVQDPWPPVAFQPERVVWRDSLALFQSVRDERSRPKTLDWLGELTYQGFLEEARSLPLDLFGVTTDQANVLFWRHERLMLPVAYLREDAADLLAELRRALDLAEATAGALDSAVRLLARLLIAPESDRPQGRQPDPKVARSLFESLSPGRLYWSRLEAPFKRLLLDLPDDRSADGGDRSYGSREMPRWAHTLRDAATDAFHESIGGLDGSGRALKAAARAGRDFNWRLNRVLGPYLSQREEVTLGSDG